MNKAETSHRVAKCSCGALSITVTGEPARTHACTCLACQRRTGTAFSYTAFFRETVVASIMGEEKIYREMRELGRWHEYHFCPTCGVSVYFHLEAAPAHVGIPVGCFADPAFAAPHHFFWTRHRPHWLSLPNGVAKLETQ